MDKQNLMEVLELEEALLADGFEEALVGFVDEGNGIRALYDLDRCESVLVERDGMPMEDAEEYIQFNVLGAFVPGRPAFARILSQQHLLDRIAELEAELVTLRSQRKEV